MKGRVHVGGVVHNGGWRCREGFMWEVWFIMVGGGVGRGSCERYGS